MTAEEDRSDQLALWSSPSWVADLAVHRGGSAAEEVVLLRATAPEHLRFLVRLGAAWSATRSGEQRPWVCFALSDDAYYGVLRHFLAACRQAEEDEGQTLTVLMGLPLDRCGLTAVSVGHERQYTLVELSAEPPALDGAFVYAVESAVRARGFGCNRPERDDGMLCTQVTYATGDSDFEVLGWDDLYTDEEWRFMRDAELVYLDLRPDVADLVPERLADLAGVTAAARNELESYYDELLAEQSLLDAQEEAEAVTSTLAGDDPRCPSSGENVGRMVEIWGSDEWRIECPTCGAMWAGGSTVLMEHDRVHV